MGGRHKHRCMLKATASIQRTNGLTQGRRLPAL
jgi:hypothetical protein